ncbi:MAG: ketoacyl-ACP synthase III [Chitinophagales bacterium]|nr:ketoacyl-ACP synthase III [Chitinophagales bacterium]
MAIFSINNISIKGIVASLPKTKVSNQNYPYHTQKEKEQFVKTTGIKYRRVADNNTTALTLCKASAEELLNKTKTDRAAINLLVFVTQTPDYTIPCSATILQNQLDLPQTCLAFDINLGCSGYVYGLSVVASLLQNTKGTALLLVGDTSTKIINEKDKATAPLFSDAGSATLLSYDGNAKPMYFNLQTDGKGYDAIIRKDGGVASPFTKKSLLFDENKGHSPIDMTLDGIKVFNFSRREVVPNINNLISSFNINKETIEYYFFHQANKLMNDSLIKKLNIEPSKAPSTLENYGNTSSASIPVTIVATLSNKPQQNYNIILSGFGVGLSWGSAYINLQNTLILAIVEI